MNIGKTEKNPLILQSTRRCACGNDKLILLRTLKRKVCSDCNTWILWELSDEQEMIA